MRYSRLYDVTKTSLTTRTPFWGAIVLPPMVAYSRQCKFPVAVLNADVETLQVFPRVAPDENVQKRGKRANSGRTEIDEKFLLS